MVNFSIQELWKHAATFGAGGLTGVIVAYVLFRTFLSSYLNQKGRNQATREDVELITNKIEAVRHDYSKQLHEIALQNGLVLEKLKSSNQLRMAALDLRLEAHQQAYSYAHRVAVQKL